MSVEEYRIAQLYMIQVTPSNIFPFARVFIFIFLLTVLNSVSLTPSSFASMQS